MAREAGARGEEVRRKAGKENALPSSVIELAAALMRKDPNIALYHEPAVQDAVVLRFLREDKGMSLETLSRVSGVNANDILMVERAPESAGPQAAAREFSELLARLSKAMDYCIGDVRRAAEEAKFRAIAKPPGK